MIRVCRKWNGVSKTSKLKNYIPRDSLVCLYLCLSYNQRYEKFGGLGVGKHNDEPTSHPILILIFGSCTFIRFIFLKDATLDSHIFIFCQMFFFFVFFFFVCVLCAWLFKFLCIRLLDYNKMMFFLAFNMKSYFFFVFFSKNKGV